MDLDAIRTESDRYSETSSLSKNYDKTSKRRSYGIGREKLDNNSEDGADEPLIGDHHMREKCHLSIDFNRGLSLTCIILHESLHSAAFYILVPDVYFMRDGPLKYTDNQAAVLILVFTGVAFFLPLFGGIIGDTILGRYKAILYGTVMEFTGMILLLIYAVLVFMVNVSVPVAKFLFITALILVAVGTGFIKANVTIFGAGQLKDTTNSSEKIQSYYRWYSFAINLGRLLAFCPIAMFLENYVPRSWDNVCPNTTSNMSFINPEEQKDEIRHRGLLAITASVLQVVFVGLAIFIFMIGKAKYKMLEPTGVHHMYYIFCFTRHQRRLNEIAQFSREHADYQYQMRIYTRSILRMTLLLAALFSMYTLFEAVSFQKFSIFMLQFEALSQPAGISVHLPLPFMNTFSTLVHVLLVPFLECCIGKRYSADDVTDDEINAMVSKYLAVEKSGRTSPSMPLQQANIIKLFRANGTSPNSATSHSSINELNEDIRRQIAEDISIAKHRRIMLIRMGIGLGCAAIGALCAGILEVQRKIHSHLSVFWQIPQYVVLGIAEVGEISAFEFASTESLPGLQGFTIGMFISTYGLGSFLAYFCYAGAARSLTNPVDLNCFHMEYVFFGQFGFLILIIVAFIVLARLYHLEHPSRLEEPKCPYIDDDDDFDDDDGKFD